MTDHILRVDASMRVSGSYSRKVADELIEKISTDYTQVTHRDLTDGVPLVNEVWIQANFTQEVERDEDQHRALQMSETLIHELEAADTLVITVPIYNFGVPAALKAWIDMITRARRTFQYGENGPEGLLTGKRAYLVFTSGGTELGSDIDFVSPWLTHILAFIGITDTEIINVSGLMKDEALVIKQAQEHISTLVSLEPL